MPSGRGRGAAAPEGLPAPLAAFYARASRLESTSTDAVAPAGQLTKLNRALARELDEEKEPAGAVRPSRRSVPVATPKTCRQNRAW